MFLQITLQYDARLGGQTEPAQYASETRPKLAVFLTHGLSRGVVARGEPGAEKGTTTTVSLPFDVQGAQAFRRQARRVWMLPDGLDEPRETDASVPASASLAVNAYAVTYTEAGQELESRVGSAYILLEAVFQQDWSTGQGMVFPLTDNTGDDGFVVKGAVRVFSARLVADGAETKTATVRFSARQKWSVMSDNEEGLQQQRMRAIQTRAMEFFFGSPPVIGKATIPYLERVHCPEYRTEALSLPGSVFSVRLPTQNPSGAVFLRAIEVVLWRIGWLRRGAVDTMNGEIERQFRDGPRPGKRVSALFHAATTLLVGLFTLYPTNEVYENDFVNEGGNTILPRSTRSRMRKRMAQMRSQAANRAREEREMRVPITESYKIVRGLGGGDCEDVACEVYIEAAQFMRLDFSGADAAAGPLRGRAELGRLLGNLQRILSLYVPMLVLMAVTNKKMEDGLRDMNPDEAMAHTVAVFFPWAQFASAFDGTLTPQEARAMKSSRAWKEAERARKPWHTELRVLVCEGTARMDPRSVLPYTYWQDDEQGRAAGWRVVQEKRAAQERVQKAFAGEAGAFLPVTMEILPTVPNDTKDGDFAQNREDVSGFYKAPVSAYVGHTFRDSGVLDVVFAVRDSRTRAVTYGAHFNRLVFPELLADGALRVIPCNALDALDRRIINDALLKLEPEPPLRLSRQAMRRDANNAVLRSLREHVVVQREAVLGEGAQGDETGKVRAAGTETGAVVLSLRDQEATPENTAKLIRAVRAIVDGDTARARTVQVRTWTLADPAASDGDWAVRNIVHDVRIDVCAGKQ